MNPVLDAIRLRRSTRQFTEEQLTRAELDTLLDAAIWAPSGGNTQTWLFTAIQNPEVLLRLNELVRAAFRTYVPDDDYPGKLGAKSYSQTEGYSFCHRAPTLIIASNVPSYENAMADAALALENIFLTAQSLGLGSCYINQLHWLRADLPLRAYLASLGIPAEHTICSSAALGHIKTPSPAPARKPGTVNIIV
ncbi:MAG: nitroreductase family protein [Oscillospiraceae bacterium]|jgi:nitroreductase|nr:nitroreductase family protein [Oscillospiraceae bacterium]